MSKRTTKDDMLDKLLQTALDRLNDAKARVRAAQAELDSANATMFAHAEGYDSLQKALTREPAKPKAPRKPRSDSGTKRKGLPTTLTEAAASNGGDTDGSSV